MFNTEYPEKDGTSTSIPAYALVFKVHGINNKSKVAMNQNAEKVCHEVSNLIQNFNDILADEDCMKFTTNPKCKDNFIDLTNHNKMKKIGYSTFLMFKYAVYVSIVTEDEILPYDELSEERKNCFIQLVFGKTLLDFMKNDGIDYEELFKKRYEMVIQDLAEEAEA